MGKVVVFVIDKYGMEFLFFDSLLCLAYFANITILLVSHSVKKPSGNCTHFNTYLDSWGAFFIISPLLGGSFLDSSHACKEASRYFPAVLQFRWCPA